VFRLVLTKWELDKARKDVKHAKYPVSAHLLSVGIALVPRVAWLLAGCDRWLTLPLSLQQEGMTVELVFQVMRTCFALLLFARCCAHPSVCVPVCSR
jgi:hypothetical protein